MSIPSVQNSNMHFLGLMMGDKGKIATLAKKEATVRKCLCDIDHTYQIID